MESISHLFKPIKGVMNMTLTAIITLSICLIVAWGGLALAMVRLVKIEAKGKRRTEDGEGSYQGC